MANPVICVASREAARSAFLKEHPGAEVVADFTQHAAALSDYLELLSVLAAWFEEMATIRFPPAPVLSQRLRDLAALDTFAVVRRAVVMAEQAQAMVQSTRGYAVLAEAARSVAVAAAERREPSSVLLLLAVMWEFAAGARFTAVDLVRLGVASGAEPPINPPGTDEASSEYQRRRTAWEKRLKTMRRSIDGWALLKAQFPQLGERGK